MYKFAIILIALLTATTTLASCSKVPEQTKQVYASEFFQAFASQSQGKSIIASCQFQNAYRTAKEAGENIHKLLILEQLFVWYRMYGSSLGLFYVNPTGYDRIIGEYSRSLSTSSRPYKSEWGKTPEQAALMREFMLGIAETVSGVFCIAVGGVATSAIGLGLVSNGGYRIYSSLNNIYSAHERAMIELKKWEENAKKASQAE